MTAFYSQIEIKQREVRMAQETHTAEKIAFALWPLRSKYRNLHEAEFLDEVSLLVAVKTDLSLRNFTDLEGAKDFYKDLNHSF